MKSVKIKGPHAGLTGRLSFPGDKSLSHRAIIFGALAEGKSHFTNVLAGEDVVCTRRAFEEMGVKIESRSGGTDLVVHGVGSRGLKAPKKDLYLGNSGTSMRLLMGVLAGQNFSATLTGDASLSSRPMRRVGDFLVHMGAKIEGKGGGNYAPLTITGGKLQAIDAKMPVASAQVKSALLLAGLYADGTTRVSEPEKSRDHTERFLKHFGASIEESGNSVSIRGGQALTAKSFPIAGDISSAAFFMAAALLVKNSSVQLENVLGNPTRSGIARVLERSCAFKLGSGGSAAGPEIAENIHVWQQSIKAFDIKREELPSLIDEIPILCVLATQAEGQSVIRDAGELRVKESDRIESIQALLRPMGADIRSEGSSLFIKGPVKLKGAVVDSRKDHRIAMSGVVAGLVAGGETVVQDIECINTSFPGFFERLKALKVPFELRD